MRHRRPGAVSRGGSRGSPRHRNRLLLRRTGARVTRVVGAWVAEPVPLFDGAAGRRPQAHDGARVRVGTGEREGPVVTVVSQERSAALFLRKPEVGSDSASE